MAYSSKNACTQKPSALSIITFILYLVQVALHSVYIVPGVIKINHPILWVFLGVHYACLMFVMHDYVWIMVHDPVDRLVLDPDLIENFEYYQLEDCHICGKRIKGSHHCSTCGRCTEDFDHHCKFLNNCIGKHNYEVFIRLLSLNLLYFTISIGESIWVLAAAIRNSSVREAIPPSFYVIIGLIFISVILFISILILEVFHCYISFNAITTLDYIIDNPSTDSKKDENPPETSRRLK